MWRVVEGQECQNSSGSMISAMTTTDTTTAAPKATQIRMISRRARSSLCDAQFSIALNTLIALYPPIASSALTARIAIIPVVPMKCKLPIRKTIIETPGHARLEGPRARASSTARYRYHVAKDR